jgi:hypothetical protein
MATALWPACGSHRRDRDPPCTWVRRGHVATPFRGRASVRCWPSVAAARRLGPGPVAIRHLPGRNARGRRCPSGDSCARAVDAAIRARPGPPVGSCPLCSSGAIQRRPRLSLPHRSNEATYDGTCALGSLASTGAQAAWPSPLVARAFPFSAARNPTRFRRASCRPRHAPCPACAYTPTQRENGVPP